VEFGGCFLHHGKAPALSVDVFQVKQNDGYSTPSPFTIFRAVWLLSFPEIEDGARRKEI
jgi:hypothetical protein